MSKRLFAVAAVLGLCSVAQPAAASAAESAPFIRALAAPVSAPTHATRAAPWCDRTLWKGDKRRRDTFIGRANSVKKWVARIDKATDAIALALAGFSMGSLAAPVAIVKFVAKFGGKELIEAVANSLIKQAYKYPRAAHVGAMLKVKCKWGSVPYPAFSVYT